MRCAREGTAVRFEVQGTNAFLTALRVFSQRYGPPYGPDEQFFVWLCDPEYKLLAGFRFPYSRFSSTPGGGWVTLEVPPTPVPRQFIISLGLYPTTAKGIHVYHDSLPGGYSLSALPGRLIAPFTNGNWLLRAELDRAKER